MIVLFVVLIIMLTIVVGAVLALAITQLDKAVVTSASTLAKHDKSYNQAITLGYKIPIQDDTDAQLKEARRLAAKQAAAMPRGANMRIGSLREQNGKQPTAFDGVQEDPITAVKIAAVHGWDSLRTGIVIGGPAPAAAAAVPTATATGEIELVPGKDYPVIEITDDMPDADKRKARIANAKAKSAAMKAAKASGQVGAAVPAAAAAAAAPAAAQTVSPAAAAGIPKPDLIEITDDMAPDEVRKARIANSKANAAYNKALKAAGIDPSAASATPPAAAAPPAAPAVPSADATALAGIPKPDLIEISDDMPADEVRRARIANAKANAAYNKALKAAGIDPATVN